MTLHDYKAHIASFTQNNRINSHLVSISEKIKVVNHLRDNLTLDTCESLLSSLDDDLDIIICKTLNSTNEHKE